MQIPLLGLVLMLMLVRCKSGQPAKNAKCLLTRCVA
jgi:hypothetical protein